MEQRNIFLGEVACEEMLGGWGGDNRSMEGICVGAVRLETCGAR